MSSKKYKSRKGARSKRVFLSSTFDYSGASNRGLSKPLVYKSLGLAPHKGEKKNADYKPKELSSNKETLLKRKLQEQKQEIKRLQDHCKGVHRNYKTLADLCRGNIACFTMSSLMLI